LAGLFKAFSFWYRVPSFYNRREEESQAKLAGDSSPAAQKDDWCNCSTLRENALKRYILSAFIWKNLEKT
jgi:hypothetical protein